MASAALVVMAAGIGSRYGGLKQIDPVGPAGEIVLDYTVFDAIRAGFDKVVFVIRRDIEEAFRQKVAPIERRIETAYVFQDMDRLPAGFSLSAGRAKPWGTGHAVLCAAEAVDRPFAVANADDFYGAESFAVLADFLHDRPADTGIQEYAMVGFTLANTLTEAGYVSRGVCTACGDGYLQSIVERTRIEKDGEGARFTEDGSTWQAIDPACLVSMNLWGFGPELFAELDRLFRGFLQARGGEPKAEFYIPTAVNDLMTEGKARVRVLPTAARWLGVTYPQDKARVKQAVADLVAQGKYPPSLWSE